MNRRAVIITIAILLTGSVLLGLSDTDYSVADTTIPHNEITSSVSKASNSSESAIIKTKMYTLPNE